MSGRMVPSPTAARTAARRAERRASVPPIEYPEALPISARRGEVMEAIAAHPVVIVAGETGSGKSTQLPKMCLELGRGVAGLIGHTQPRRLAARTIAARVADELGTPLGDLVGYSVRFTDQVSERTLVKVMTDGILLAELGRDRRLGRYDTLIIDEAHERSLTIDFLLGYLTDLLPRRPDLKVIITSATIDTDRFARHFDAPVVEVSGRSHPVELRYRPLGDPTDGGTGSMDQVDGIRRAVDELRAERPGDILVFLSGEREIRDTAAALAEADLPDTELLPLYARLSAAEQQRAFRPHRGRRIVLATNVAETSITVPGVRYVVDPGTARISRFSRRTKVQRLPIEPVSQASADQRAGRCGRVAPGICIRLYGEDDYQSRPRFTEPEILRTSLASVILRMAALGLGEVASFPFVDPPDAHAVRDAVALLTELGALRDDGGLTPLGRRLARLPVDPRFGRMIIEADRLGCVREVLVLAAALSIQDVRERPTGQEEEADALHARFAVPDSDFLGTLALWRYLEEQQRERSSSGFRRMCRAEHLHHVRVREWQDLVRQLREVAAEVGIRRRSGPPAAPDAVHRAVLAGLLSHVGMYDPVTRDHRGARGARFLVAPGSVLHRRTPGWVMAGELVETTRLWARQVARIDPGWIEPLAGHLVRRSYGEVTWDERRGAAMTTERVMLYGLPVVEGRRVAVARVDEVLARRMFVDHALAAGEWEGRYGFVERNRALLDEVRALEDRARRRDLMVGDEVLAAFFDARVPATVTSARAFDRWWRRAREETPDLLTLTRSDVVATGAGAVGEDDFPTTWRQGDLALPVSYTFGPGADDDGVTVHVPLAVLNRLDPGGFDWQVPGHRLDLVTALVRSLPKGARRRLVPAPDRAAEALAGIGPGDGPLLEVLARRLASMAGEPVAPADFDLARVPAHLLVRFRVEDGAGAEVAAGRDLADLRRRLAPDARRAVAAAAPKLERRGLVTWSIGTLPRVVDAPAGAGLSVRGYPALVDEGSTVGVRVLTGEDEQARAMAAGTGRLLALAVPAARRDAERRLRTVPALAAAPARYPGPAALADDCVAAAADRIVAAEGGPAWDEGSWSRLAAAARTRLPRLAAGAATQAGDLVAAAVSLESSLAEVRAEALRPAAADMRAQVRSLVGVGFVTRVGLSRLKDVGRYLEAVRVRLDKLPDRPDRDAKAMATARAVEAEFTEARAKLPPDRRAAPEVVDLAWQLEELRVSLFAQTLGTPRPVSEQRLRRAIAALAG
jgi:ATP-dependent helicase HrpA